MLDKEYFETHLNAQLEELGELVTTVHIHLLSNREGVACREQLWRKFGGLGDTTGHSSKRDQAMIDTPSHSSSSDIT